MVDKFQAQGPDLLHQVPGVIDNFVRSQVFAPLNALPSRGGGNHMKTRHVMGQLNRHRPDPARTANDQNAFLPVLRMMRMGNRRFDRFKIRLYS